MRRSKWWVFGIGLGLLGMTPLVGTARADSIGNTFSDAWSSVRSGAEATARWGSSVIDKAADGTIRAVDATKRGTASIGDSAKNTWVKEKVKNKIHNDKFVQGNWHVDVTDGVVTLTGIVGSEAQAARAVEDALSTSGVYAVNSTLGWASMQAPVQTKYKEPPPAP